MIRVRRRWEGKGWATRKRVGQRERGMGDVFVFEVEAASPGNRSYQVS